MGPTSYTRSGVDRNVVMLRMTVKMPRLQHKYAEVCMERKAAVSEDEHFACFALTVTSDRASPVHAVAGLRLLWNIAFDRRL
jgi:hypothetical protein